MASPAFATKSDDTLRFGSQTTLPSLDKYFNSGNTAGMIAHAVWDMLLYRDPRTGELEPGLATAWRWIDDKTLELDLRDGVRFHNGAVFEADDVVYTLNFVADPKNKAPFERLAPWFARVEKVNPRRVRIFMKKVSPAAVAELASLDLPIYPHAYYAAVGPKGMGVRPIGTGPYRVTGYAPGKFVRLERNSAHFRDSPKPQPQISKIEIRFIPDAQTRVAEIVSGGLDLIVNVDRDQAEQLREIPNLQVISGETTEVARLVLSTLPYSSAPQLRDVRVRRAIMHAVDREAVAKHLVGENSRVLHALCHPLEFGCDDSAVPRYAYDPSRAKRLLAEAGYPNGFDLDLYAIRDRNQVEAIIGRHPGAAALCADRRDDCRKTIRASAFNKHRLDSSNSGYLPLGISLLRIRPQRCEPRSRIARCFAAGRLFHGFRSAPVRLRTGAAPD
jgi:peptide/nickel transport system substrate-binding protein